MIEGFRKGLSPFEETGTLFASSSTEKLTTHLFCRGGSALVDELVQLGNFIGGKHVLNDSVAVQVKQIFLNSRVGHNASPFVNQSYGGTVGNRCKGLTRENTGVEYL